MRAMNRREAIKATTALVGGVLATAAGGLVACDRERRAGSSPGATPRALSRDDEALVEEIADTLLPTTAASPGAKAAGAGAAINLLLTDCYEAESQRRVVRGLDEFRATCRARRGHDFASLAPAERELLLREIDSEAQRVGESHYLGLVRELALRAYFSSEVGATRALRYVLTPGRWEGCVKLQPGQPAWA